MTGQRTGTRRPFALPAWWSPVIEVLIAVAMLALLATAGLVAYTVTRPVAPARPTPINITLTVAPAAPATPAPVPAPTKKAPK